MNLRNRSISKYEVETLFRDVLNQKQIEEISKIIKILAVYVFCTKEQLNEFSKRIYNTEIGLSYLQKAVKYKLIAELQSDLSSDKYYFQWKNSAFYFCEAIDFDYRKFKLDATKKDKEKILAINNYLLKNNHLLSLKYSKFLFEPIFTKDNTVLLIKDNEQEIAELIATQILRTKDLSEVYMTFEFERMKLENVEIDEKIKGNLESTI